MCVCHYGLHCLSWGFSHSHTLPLCFSSPLPQLSLHSPTGEMGERHVSSPSPLSQPIQPLPLRVLRSSWSFFLYPGTLISNADPIAYCAAATLGTYFVPQQPALFSLGFLVKGMWNAAAWRVEPPSLPPSLDPRRAAAAVRQAGEFMDPNTHVCNSGMHLWIEGVCVGWHGMAWLGMSRGIHGMDGMDIWSVCFRTFFVFDHGSSLNSADLDCASFPSRSLFSRSGLSL